MVFIWKNGEKCGPKEFRMKLELSGESERVEMFDRFLEVCEAFRYDFGNVDYEDGIIRCVSDMWYPLHSPEPPRMPKRKTGGNMMCRM